MADRAIPDRFLREVTLASTAEERERYDSLANLFAIIRTLEFLEKAYVKDTIKQADYARECDKLLSQFQVAKSHVGDGSSFDIDQFMKDYGLKCIAAKKRIEAGVNQFVIDGDGVKAKNEQLLVFEATSYFISLENQLELGINTKEDIHPLLVQILENLNKHSKLAPKFTGKQTVAKWISVLANIGAMDTLDEKQLSTLKFDIATEFAAYKHAIE